MGSLFLARVKQGGARYWHLKHNQWERLEDGSGAGRYRQRYITSLGRISRTGTVCRISRRRAEQVAWEASHKLGETVTVDDIERVRRLQVVDDPT